MLPTEPQSIIKVILGGVTAYRKNILMLVPISILLSALYVASNILLKIEQLWALVAQLPLLFLIIFCFYGALSFVYNLLSKQEASYRISLETDLRTFFKAIILPFGLAAIMILYSIILYASGVITLVLSNALFFITFFVINLIFLLAAICFSIVYTMEIIIKNSSIRPSIKKAAKIGFKTENIFKTLCFMLLLTLLSVLVFSFTAILMFFLTSIYEKLFVHIPDLMFKMSFAFIFLTLLWTPIKLTTIVYFYNDLNLRFENNLPPISLFRRLFGKMAWFRSMDRTNSSSTPKSV